jgi:hypothetical protein
MDNLNEMLEKGFYDKDEQQKVNNFLEEDAGLDPNVRELKNMFPALAQDNDPVVPQKKSDVPEYKQEKPTYDQEENASKPKKLTQNQRQKRLLAEQQQKILELEREKDQLVLSAALQQQNELNAHLLLLEQEKRDLAKRAEDEVYRKKYYDSNNQYEESLQADLAAMKAIAEEKKREDEIRLLKAQYEQKNKIINQAYNEYQNKNYTYKENYEFEEDPHKRNALEQFLNQHNFLDNRHNNPNFSPRLRQKADQLAVMLEDKYKIEGRGHEVQSPSFFQDLSNTLKENLRNEFSTNQNQQGYNPSTNNYGDGMNINKFSTDFSAPVTPTSGGRIKYSAPMNSDQREVRSNFIQAAKNLGLGEENLAETYDNIYNQYKQSY